MSEFEGHTPGPWFVGTDHLGDDLLVYVPSTAPNGHAFKLAIASVWDAAGPPENEHNMQANARLIAAAPDLLSRAERAEAENKFLHQRRGELVIERDRALAQLMEWTKGDGPNQQLLEQVSSSAMKAAIAEARAERAEAQRDALWEALEGIEHGNE